MQAHARHGASSLIHDVALATRGRQGRPSSRPKRCSQLRFQISAKVCAQLGAALLRTARPIRTAGFGAAVACARSSSPVGAVELLPRPAGCWRCAGGPRSKEGSCLARSGHGLDLSFRSVLCPALAGEHYCLPGRFNQSFRQTQHTLIPLDLVLIQWTLDRNSQYGGDGEAGGRLMA